MRLKARPPQLPGRWDRRELWVPAPRRPSLLCGSPVPSPPPSRSRSPPCQDPHGTHSAHQGLGSALLCHPGCSLHQPGPLSRHPSNLRVLSRPGQAALHLPALGAANPRPASGSHPYCATLVARASPEGCGPGSTRLVPGNPQRHRASRSGVTGRCSLGEGDVISPHLALSWGTLDPGPQPAPAPPARSEPLLPLPFIL